MRPRAGTVRVEQSELAGLFGGDLAVQCGELSRMVGSVR